MVRLNEPPVLGDTVEALKRRFIRQNREIARANSTQSAKIRTLECETSRLLSENIALREENIRLQKVLEEAQGKQGAVNISVFKDKFESKVQELTELLGELSASSVGNDERPTPGKLRRKAARQSLFQRMRPSPEQIAENAVAEGRLAPIFEEKATFDKDFDDDVRLSIPELADITNSPDLGPPAKAYVEEGDPMKLSLNHKAPSEGSPSKACEVSEDTERQAGFLSSNLEKRKRRREIATANGATAATSYGPIETSTEVKANFEDASKETVKIGAKRKLGSREEDSKPLEKSSSLQNIGLNARSSRADSDVRRPKSHINLSSIGASMSKVQSRSTPGLAATQGRKALGEKPVNTDPVVSPGKPRQQGVDKPSEPKKELTARPRERIQGKERPIIRQIRPLKSQVEDSQPVVDEIRVPPTTPAFDDDDVFLPDSSRPSSTRIESKDTPPPGALQDESANAAARPSRRQRSAVSYAEPSLRDKMRRPGKEMVDAISGLQRSRASISELPSREDHFLSGDLRSERGNAAQSVAANTLSYKSKDPTSPLNSRSTGGSLDLDSSTISAANLPDRHRRSTVTVHSRSLSAEESRANKSQDTISALISSSQKKLARVGGASFETSRPSEAEASSLVDSLSVFDLHLSSPARGDATTTITTTTDESVRAESKPRAVRVSKRHSSVAEALGKPAMERESHSKRGAEEMSGEDGSRVDLGGARRAERAERRRSMMV